uniref:Uncharacterized protein n=1 Tax=Rhizophora mucronata TaxID=61149 RepID=A0A2P2PUQ1_RHIMU
MWNLESEPQKGVTIETTPQSTNAVKGPANERHISRDHKLHNPLATQTLQFS